MVKINDKQHITKDGLVKKNPKNVPRYKVYWATPTTWGYDETDPHFFTVRSEAEKYLAKIRDEMVQDPDTEEDTQVHLKDLATGELKAFILDDSADEGYQEWTEWK